MCCPNWARRRASTGVRQGRSRGPTAGTLKWLDARRVSIPPLLAARVRYPRRPGLSAKSVLFRRAIHMSRAMAHPCSTVIALGLGNRRRCWQVTVLAYSVTADHEWFPYTNHDWLPALTPPGVLPHWSRCSDIELCARRSGCDRSPALIRSSLSSGWRPA